MSSDYDRTVHAQLKEDGIVTQVVRYDKSGRWWCEVTSDAAEGRTRIATVHDAAQQAIELEQAGGTIYLRQPGGRQFDAKVAGAKGRMSRR